MSQSRYSDKEEARLDDSIRNHYQSLHKGRKLLEYRKLSTLPANTIIRYKGNYPNRTGIKIIKYNVQPDPLNPSGIKSSEEKSFYLEFNGSVLSRVEYTVKKEETGSSPRTITKIIDESPMDDDINDIEIHAYEGIIRDVVPLSFLKNEGIHNDRNNFKKNFYLRLLQDSLIQVNLLLELQKKAKNKQHNRRLNQLKNSLGY